MHTNITWPRDKQELYSLLKLQAVSLAEATPLPLPALANCAALLWEALSDINWAGFYLMHGDTLVLGPFQGKTACTLIPSGKGVCGTAAATRVLQLVPDVHQFPGHIACDSASNSEIVLPIHVNGKIWGVLDIDSPSIGRFTEEDRIGLEKFVTVLETMLAK